jgi:uncharacterized protein YunC (DUF1805 family)
MKNQTKQRGSLLVKTATIAIASVLSFGGCASLTSSNTNSQSPLTENKTFKINGAQVVGVKLLKKNGKIFAGYFRATNGLVVCPHFDLKAMAKAKIAVAMSGKWATNTLDQGLNEKIIQVNALAAKKGVKVGMNTKDALKLLDSNSKRNTINKHPNNGL